MLNRERSTPKLSFGLSNLGVPVSIICLVIGGEYLFRHYVLFWMPTIGTLSVNDMISLFLVYFLLLLGIGKVMKTIWRQELAGIWQATQESVRSWKFLLWFVLLVLSITVLPFFDRLFLRRFTLPMMLSPYRNSALWLEDFTPMLKALSFISVNGFFVPIAEEYL